MPLDHESECAVGLRARPARGFGRAAEVSLLPILLQVSRHVSRRAAHACSPRSWFVPPLRTRANARLPRGRFLPEERRAWAAADASRTPAGRDEEFRFGFSECRRFSGGTLGSCVVGGLQPRAVLLAVETAGCAGPARTATAYRLKARELRQGGIVGGGDGGTRRELVREETDVLDLRLGRARFGRTRRHGGRIDVRVHPAAGPRVGPAPRKTRRCAERRGRHDLEDANRVPGATNGTDLLAAAEIAAEAQLNDLQGYSELPA